ncbi:hypothetical protein EJ03DRAFT_166751 [Teratosphaeria nubilosa]|uniref:Uncharacterized protein n=1 Tax=Teratosphaeria nubilosa TaxID=161662 RepID=A0A6G1L3K4_9PEZI|nr:hypothetical protein EJ03DRAFT_166751 [Teratosphaeria nubilosa]
MVPCTFEGYEHRPHKLRRASVSSLPWCRRCCCPRRVVDLAAGPVRTFRDCLDRLHNFCRLTTTCSTATHTAPDALTCHQQLVLRALSAISMLIAVSGAPLHHSEAEGRNTPSLLHHQRLPPSQHTLSRWRASHMTAHLNSLSEPSTDLGNTFLNDWGKTRACSTPQPPPTHCRHPLHLQRPFRMQIRLRQEVILWSVGSPRHARGHRCFDNTKSPRQHKKKETGGTGTTLPRQQQKEQRITLTTLEAVESWALRP